MKPRWFGERTDSLKRGGGRSRVFAVSISGGHYKRGRPPVEREERERRRVAVKISLSPVKRMRGPRGEDRIMDGRPAVSRAAYRNRAVRTHSPWC